MALFLPPPQFLWLILPSITRSLFNFSQKYIALQIHGHLGALARTACASALAALRERADALDERPSSLPEFAAYQVTRMPGATYMAAAEHADQA
jgi:hypothetical protein